MNNLLNPVPVALTAPEMVINLIVAMVLGLAMSWLYKRFHRGISYSQSFVSTLPLITLIAALVIMVIGNSLARAFGLIGAFTIVRFRTAVKDTRDMAFLFLALTLGIASGTGAFSLGILGLAAMGLLIGFMDRTKFGEMLVYEYVLSFVNQTNKNGDESYQKVFKKYLKEHMLLNVRSGKAGRELELSFNIRLKKVDEVRSFVSELGRIKSVSRVELLDMNNDVDY